MAEETKVRDNIGDQHDDGLWPDFATSAESSVHENLPNHFGEKDNLYPDEELSVQSVKDGAEVLAQHGFAKDELYPDEELSRKSAEDNARQLDEAEAARTSSTSEAEQPKPAKKAAAKKTASAES